MVAIAANDAWAVGSSGYNAQTLAEHWDGTAWSVVPSPNAGTGNNRLLDVDVVSANDVWAVGAYNPVPGTGQKPLTLHWDGTQWSVVGNPGTSGPRQSPRQPC